MQGDCCGRSVLVHARTQTDDATLSMAPDSSLKPRGWSLFVRDVQAGGRSSLASVRSSLDTVLHTLEHTLDGTLRNTLRRVSRPSARQHRGPSVLANFKLQGSTGQLCEDKTPEHTLYASGKAYMEQDKYDLAMVEFELCKSRVDKKYAYLRSRMRKGRGGRGLGCGCGSAPQTSAEEDAKVLRLLETDFGNLEAQIDRCALLMERELALADARDRRTVLFRSTLFRSSHREEDIDFSRRTGRTTGRTTGALQRQTEVSFSQQGARGAPMSRSSMFRSSMMRSSMESRSSMIRPVPNKGYHVFISYRVASDASLAEKLYYQLTATGLRVWWDKACLESGARWEDGFMQGLLDSACFVPILSRGALARFATLTPESPSDSVLLEHQLALELHEAGELAAILPVLAGDLVPSPAGELMYVPFFQCAPPAKPACPNVVVESVERQLRRAMGQLRRTKQLQRRTMGHLRVRPRDAHSVRGTLDTLLGFQGAIMKGLVDQAMSEVLHSVTVAAESAVSGDALDAHLHRETSAEGSGAWAPLAC